MTSTVSAMNIANEAASIASRSSQPGTNLTPRAAAH